ncbi:MAG: response regulator [Planctomycetota bacterium]
MDKKKILWVDDDEDLVLAFQARLMNEGWDVQTAFSAKQAKAMLTNYTPDIIIMDVIMDEQHGYSAIEDIKEYPKLADIPIIVFSSVSQKWSETTATREDALLSDATEFVNKSSTPDELIRTIHKYLDN